LKTISCLLIQPNPDSALNATAGKLLQEDYNEFANQAKLMTSIHAPVPASLKEASLQARSRGEDKPSAPTLTTTPPPETQNESLSDNEEDDAKENDPSLSASPVSAAPPPFRRPALGKRPLSDLPTPVESDEDDNHQPRLSASERNIVANTPNLSAGVSFLSVSCDGDSEAPQLAERNQISNFAGRSEQGSFIGVYEDEEELPPKSKRLCSSEGKENSGDGVALFSLPQPLQPSTTANAVGLGLALGVRTSSAPNPAKRSFNSTSASSARSGVSKGVARPRAALRRL
jgi:ubiquitin-conjugating enzyme E2 S